MKKSFISALCVGLLLACGVAFTAPAQDATNNTNPPIVATAKKAPFRGTIASIDKTAKTITLKGPKKQVIHITEATKITKEKLPVTFDSISVGTLVTGLKQKISNGDWQALSLRIGAHKPAASKKADSTTTPAK